MKLTVDALAEQINEAAPGYEVGGLQQFRAQLHRRRARTRKIFSAATIFDDYAFHDGGRTELQYNIGRETDDGDPWWRHGVAFSFERSQTLPDPSILIPKVERFNAWVRANPRALKGFKMSSWSGVSGWSGEKTLADVPKEWMEDGIFIFIGKRYAASALNVDAILDDFDRLYPAYRFVESGKK
jgi:hypothetical protein